MYSAAACTRLSAFRIYGVFSDTKSTDGSERGKPLWSNETFGRATVQILAIRAIEDKAPITIQRSLCMVAFRSAEYRRSVESRVIDLDQLGVRFRATLEYPLTVSPLSEREG